MLCQWTTAEKWCGISNYLCSVCQKPCGYLGFLNELLIIAYTRSFHLMCFRRLEQRRRTLSSSMTIYSLSIARSRAHSFQSLNHRTKRANIWIKLIFFQWRRERERKQKYRIEAKFRFGFTKTKFAGRKFRDRNQRQHQLYLKFQNERQSFETSSPHVKCVQFKWMCLLTTYNNTNTLFWLILWWIYWLGSSIK